MIEGRCRLCVNVTSTQHQNLPKINFETSYSLRQLTDLYQNVKLFHRPYTNLKSNHSLLTKKQASEQLKIRYQFVTRFFSEVFFFYQRHSYFDRSNEKLVKLSLTTEKIVIHLLLLKYRIRSLIIITRKMKFNNLTM